MAVNRVLTQPAFSPGLLGQQLTFLACGFDSSLSVPASVQFDTLSTGANLLSQRWTAVGGELGHLSIPQGLVFFNDPALVADTPGISWVPTTGLTFNWSSSAPSVATIAAGSVSSSGIGQATVTLVAGGSTTISATETSSGTVGSATLAITQVSPASFTVSYGDNGGQPYVYTWTNGKRTF